MLKYFVAIAMVLSGTVGVSGCASRAETVGTVGGAAAGGALGSSVTGGSTIGTVGGAAAGGYIGNQLGKDYHKKHND
jgi:osmotically inducible lipoprotein OsmB